MKPFRHKQPFLLEFIVILFLVTQTNSNFTSITSKVEANQTNTTAIDSGLNKSITNMTNMNMTSNNAIQHVIIIIMENKG